MGAAEAIDRLSRSPHWVWTAIDPASQRRLHVQSGERTRAMAHVVLQQLAPLWAPGCVPLLLSDGAPNSLTALVTPGGPWMPPPRRQAPGPGPTPRWRPRPGLLSAPVVHASRCRRLVEVKHRVVCGTTGAVDQLLAACGWHLNTSVVARLHLRLRQRVAARGRRSAMPCQSDEGLGQQRALCQVYHTFGGPYASVRQALAAPDFHVWNRRGQGGATVYPGHGSWTHRSCVEPKRGAAVPRATVATAPDALRNGAAF